MFSEHSREQAMALGLKRYFIGEPCRHGHIAERNVPSGHCLECGRARSAKWNAANRELVNERRRNNRAANPEKTREKNREAARKRENKDEIKRTRAAWRAANPQYWRERYAKNKDRIRSQQAAWRAANKDRMRSLQAAWYVKNKDRILTQQAAKRTASKDSRSAITNEAGMNRRMRESCAESANHGQLENSPA
jgi:hypothetical protein